MRSACLSSISSNLSEYELVIVVLLFADDRMFSFTTDRAVLAYLYTSLAHLDTLPSNLPVGRQEALDRPEDNKSLEFVSPEELGLDAIR